MTNIVVLQNSFFELFPKEKEFLHNDSPKKRPYLIPIKLEYKGNKVLFAIPFRSNIQTKVSSFQYYGLPPNNRTKKGHAHGLHFLKMFPVSREYLQEFLVDVDDKHHTLIKKKISKEKKRIVDAAQRFINKYENIKTNEGKSKHSWFSMVPDWDYILKELHKENPI